MLGNLGVPSASFSGALTGNDSQLSTCCSLFLSLLLPPFAPTHLPEGPEGLDLDDQETITKMEETGSFVTSGTGEMLRAGL